MRVITSVILGLIVVSSVSVSAHAVTKCSVEKTKFTTAERKLSAQERKIASLEQQQQVVLDRGSDRTASLESKVSDGKAQVYAASINAGGDAVACWLLPPPKPGTPSRCADTTVRNAARRYASAVRSLERAEGQLKAWQDSQSRKLNTIQVRIDRENKALEVRKQESAAAEAAYQRCIG